MCHLVAALQQEKVWGLEEKKKKNYLGLHLSLSFISAPTQAP